MLTGAKKATVTLLPSTVAITCRGADARLAAEDPKAGLRGSAITAIDHKINTPTLLARIGHTDIHGVCSCRAAKLCWTSSIYRRGDMNWNRGVSKRILPGVLSIILTLSGLLVIVQPSGAADAANGTVLCSSQSYSCVTSAYASWLSGPHPTSSSSWASQNSYGYHNCTLYAAFRLSEIGYNPGFSDNAGPVSGQ